MPDKKNDVERRNDQISEAKETISRLEGLARQHGIPESEISQAKRDTGVHEQFRKYEEEVSQEEQ